MTAPHAGQPRVLPRPACTPTAIRAVLAANADGDILQRYDEDLDAAFEQAREQGDVTPLVQSAGGSRRTPGVTPERSGSSWLASTPTGTRACRLRNSG
jgi:hypothetical protein